MLGDATRLSVSLRINGPSPDQPRLDVAFETDASVTAIMGQSGAGKSTLLSSLAGLIRPDAGRTAIGEQVVFDADAGTFVPPHRRRVSLVFQSLALFPHLCVWQNVAYGIRAASRAERRRLALGWLERARVGALADRIPSTLSGGEAQRVALARALAAEPRLLLLDEPFSALNHDLRVELAEVLRELLKARCVPVLLVTHDRGDAQRMATRVISLRSGLIEGDAPVSCEMFPVDNLANSPQTA